MRKIKGIITGIRTAGTPKKNPYNYITVKENIHSTWSTRIYHNTERLTWISDHLNKRKGAEIGLKIEAIIEENPSYMDSHNQTNFIIYADLISIKLKTISKPDRIQLHKWGY